MTSIRFRPRSSFPWVLAVALLLLAPAPGISAAKGKPIAVTAADLDGDPSCPGCFDLVIAGVGFNTVGLRLNNGDGTFSAPIALSLSKAPRAIAIGDCDGDGDLDVFASASDRTLTVFDNQQQQGIPQSFLPGNGSPLATGGVASAIVARDANGRSLDVDGDGMLDLALILRRRVVAVLLGDGQCGFGAPQVAPYTGKNITALAAGDFDGQDGVDLVFSDRFGGRAIVLVNDGSGAFLSQSEISLGAKPTSLAAGDLDGDGVADVVGTYAENKISPSSFGLAVMRGIAGVGLGAASPYGTGGRDPVAAIVGNFDGEGPTDVIALNQRGASLAFLEGIGSAVFDAPVPSPTLGTKPLAMTSGDFDRDGVLDVVVLDKKAPPNLSLCTGDGAGGFTCSALQY